MKVRRIHLLLLALGLVICAVVLRSKIRTPVASVIGVLNGEKSVADRLAQFADTVHGRLGPRFKDLSVRYPPEQLILVGLKQERVLEVWVSGGQNGFRLLKTYPILGASGRLGPKLREGDNQVPEGLYQVDSLNPNSQYHLALRLNYPNDFDQKYGRLDGRAGLGSDIMIHGASVSAGCLAVGDQAIEDLFVLAAETGTRNVSVILSPVDFRVREPAPLPLDSPAWTPALYADIRIAFERLTSR